MMSVEPSVYLPNGVYTLSNTMPSRKTVILPTVASDVNGDDEPTLYDNATLTAA